LAAWLESRDVDPSKVAVGTKWGYDYTAKWQVNEREIWRERERARAPSSSRL
jgi:hypothetical protein